MNRSTLSYGAMIAVFGGGIVGILKAGAGLRPPPSIEGHWTLTPLDEGARQAPSPSNARIEQSGRILRIFFDGGPRLSGRADLRIGDNPAGSAQFVEVTLRSPPWTFVAEGEAGDDRLRVRLAGPRAGTFQATRLPDPPP